MTNASRNAFLQGMKSGKFKSEKVQIYRLILGRPQTLVTLKIALQKSNKGDFSSRLNDLQSMGLIKSIDAECGTIYAPVPETEWDYYARKHAQKKAENWLKQGLNNGYFDLFGYERKPKQLTIFQV